MFFCFVLFFNSLVGMFSGYCRELRQKRNDFIGFKSRLAAMYTTDALIGSKRSEGHLHFSESFKRRAPVEWRRVANSLECRDPDRAQHKLESIRRHTHIHTRET